MVHSKDFPPNRVVAAAAGRARLPPWVSPGRRTNSCRATLPARAEARAWRKPSVSAVASARQATCRSRAQMGRSQLRAQPGARRGSRRAGSGQRISMDPLDVRSVAFASDLCCFQNAHTNCKYREYKSVVVSRYKIIFILNSCKVSMYKVYMKLLKYAIYESACSAI